MNKKVVAIVFGGHSPEYEVSLKSSYSIINAIDREKYEIILLGITRMGLWYRFYGPVEDITADNWSRDESKLSRAFISPERGGGLVELKNGELITVPVDAVFPVLHGRYGEDGTIQGLCELAGIPCVGSGAAASALCMDKDRAHKLVSWAGIKVPKSVCFEHVPKEDELHAACGSMVLPLYVKPVKAGSSVGVTRIESLSALSEAVAFAFTIDDAVLIEENIDGTEMGIAVIGNNELIAGRVDEVEITNGFFTYEEKYNLITAKIHLPARISPEMEARLQEAGKIIYKILGCAGYCRIDLFVTKDNEIVFNEANTIPGFTAKSRFPKMMAGIGVEYPELVDRLIGFAISKA